MWPYLLLALNILLVMLAWLNKNQWAYKYITSAFSAFWHHTPWYHTNELLKQLVDEVKTQSGTPLKEALQHLDISIQNMAGTLAMIHVRQRMYDRVLGNAVITTDASGKAVWASETLLELLGTSMENFLGENWINFVHQDDRELVLREWGRAVEVGRDFALSYRYVNALTNQLICVEARAYAAKIAVHLKPAGWVAFIKEIDENACNVARYRHLG